jgi:cytochrome c peroxidase
MVPEIEKTPLRLFFIFIQHASRGVARKDCRQARYRVSSSVPNPIGSGWIGRLHLGKPFPQARGIQLTDGKNAHTALGTSRPACKPFAAAPSGIGKRGVDDLHQSPVLGSWEMRFHCSGS